MAETLVASGRARSELTLIGGQADAPAPIGVVIADGHSLVRAGFRALLVAQPDVAVLGEAAGVEEALGLARRTRPTILLMDIGLPGGLWATRRMAADPDLAGIQLVVLTACDSDEHVLGAVRAGVSGFLLKDTGPSELVGAVRAVAAGHGVLSPSVARRLMDEFAALPDPNGPVPEQLEELTPRELEVVALVAGGMSNQEIAEYLVVSPATAKTHVSRALCKLGARDRAQLVTLAYESGLVLPAPRRRSPPGARPAIAA
jgi:DNA-binding NarL/FixJ family response regulator